MSDGAWDRLPDGWDVKTLGELYEIARGGSPRPIKSYITNEENGINWIKISDATNSSKYIVETKQKIKPSGIKKSRMVYKGDLILSNSMSFGRPYIMKTEGCIHDGWLVLHSEDNQIDNNFAYLILGSNIVFKQFDSLAAGSTVRNLNTNLVKKVKIPLPPLEEQQRIVTLLDDAFAAIEQMEAHARANAANARELFESRLNTIFTEGGDDWEIKPLGEVCENLDSKRVPITKNKRVAGDIPYYGASGIVDYVNDFIFDERLLLVSEDGANLLARTYPIAFSIDGKTWVNNHAHVLRFEKNETQKFLELYLNSISLKPYVSGMAQPKLNQKSLNSISVPIPSLEQQQAIVTELDALSQHTQALIAHYEQQLKDLAELKQSLLERAFTGQLTQTDTILQFQAEALHALVIAYIHKQLKCKDYFGKIATEKYSHLAQYWAFIPLPRTPRKLNYGVADLDALHNMSRYAAEHNYFTFEVTRLGNDKEMHKFTAGEKLDDLLQHADTALTKEQRDKLKRLTSIFDGRTAEDIEVISTVYAGWNNLIIRGEAVNDDAIVTESREHWHQKKLAIPRKKFFDAIKFLKLHDIIPDGTGLEVIGNEQGRLDL